MTCEITQRREDILSAAAVCDGWFEPLVDPMDPDYAALVAAGYLEPGNTVLPKPIHVGGMVLCTDRAIRDYMVGYGFDMYVTSGVAKLTITPRNSTAVDHLDLSGSKNCSSRKEQISPLVERFKLWLTGANGNAGIAIGLELSILRLQIHSIPNTK